MLSCCKLFSNSFRNAVVKVLQNCLTCNDILFCQLSESPASLPPCPPAETAEINQCDLADALIDTEKSHREESLDPGCLSYLCHMGHYLILESISLTFFIRAA